MTNSVTVLLCWYGMVVRAVADCCCLKIKHEVHDLYRHGRWVSNVAFFYIFSVVNSLIALINDPEPEHPLRAELAEEYTKDKKKFMKNAEEFTKRHSEKRPSACD